MRIVTGTSGYAFKEWKGPFYPDDLKDAGMLAFYASRFPTVEINNTFYQLPKEKVLLDWASKVPEDFTFATKASRRITHFARLKPESVELVEYMVRTLSVLGRRLGPILFQLPPNMKADLDKLRAFLEKLPAGPRYALEFRHESWLADDVVSALRERDVALVTIDQDDFSTPVLATSSWGYLRLHRFDYSKSALADWARRIREQPWNDAFVFFKHDHVPESEGSGPLAVQAFMRVAG